MIWTAGSSGANNTPSLGKTSLKITFSVKYKRHFKILCNAEQIPSESLSIYELQHILSNIKRRFPVPFQHMLGKEPRKKNDFIDIWISKMIPQWRYNLPPQEVAQKGVNHREDEVHQQQAIQFLSHKALPALKATETKNPHKRFCLFHINNTLRPQQTCNYWT